MSSRYFRACSKTKGSSQQDKIPSSKAPKSLFSPSQTSAWSHDDTVPPELRDARERPRSRRQALLADGWHPDKGGKEEKCI